MVKPRKEKTTLIDNFDRSPSVCLLHNHIDSVNQAGRILLNLHKQK